MSDCAISRALLTFAFLTFGVFLRLTQGRFALSSL